jgi:hypothetical protein
MWRAISCLWRRAYSLDREIPEILHALVTFPEVRFMSSVR